MFKASSVQNRISKTSTAKRSCLNTKPSFSRRQVDAASPTRRTRTQPRLNPPHFRVAAAQVPLLSGLPLLPVPPSRRVASTSHQEQLQWAPTFKVFLLERVRSAAIRCQMVAALSFLGFHSPPESSYHRRPHHVSWWRSAPTNQSDWVGRWQWSALVPNRLIPHRLGPSAPEGTPDRLRVCPMMELPASAPSKLNAAANGLS